MSAGTLTVGRKSSPSSDLGGGRGTIQCLHRSPNGEPQGSPVQHRIGVKNMVRTKKADPVELAHNVETCVCSDCKVVKLDEEVAQIAAKLAEERAWFQGHLRDTDTALAHLKERFERDAKIANPSRESLSRRIGLLEERVTDLETARSSKAIMDNTFDTKVIQRLRALEGNRPIQLGDRTESAIKSQLRKVELLLESVKRKIDDPPF